jgi:hypothetical protein
MKNNEILNELEERFNSEKKKFGFKASLDDLDNAFYLKDSILKDEFVSENLTRQICHRIMESLMMWNEYLHSLIMPNPQNMLNISEAKVLSQEEKKQITEFMKQIMELVSRNSFIGLTKDKKAEAKLIDEALSFWEKDFRQGLTKIVKKINEAWKK